MIKQYSDRSDAAEILWKALSTGHWDSEAKTLNTVSGHKIPTDRAAEILERGTLILSLQEGGVPTPAGEKSSLPGSMTHVFLMGEAYYIVGGGFDDSPEETLVAHIIWATGRDKAVVGAAQFVFSPEGRKHNSGAMRELKAAVVAYNKGMNIQTMKDYYKKVPTSARRGGEPPYASESLTVQAVCVHRTGRCIQCGLRYVQLDDRIDEVDRPTIENCHWGAHCTIEWD